MILITGGSGFLARGIMKLWPEEDYVVYSRDEYKQDLCKKQFVNSRTNIKYVLGDVKDYDRLVATLRANEVDTVIHTAAVKFIPEAEYNVNECISVNVDGTRNVLLACWHADVESVIGISTDKACLPVNTYGMTKAIMERLFIEQARLNKWCNYGLVRYGNVIGSTGSVIPLFQEQADAHGQITITDPEMTRYWITIEEAVDLVGLALSTGDGSIVIPKPRSMTLQELASVFSKSIKVVGVRPGEKRHEQLLHQQESVRAIDTGTHYVLKESGVYSEPFILSSNTPEAGWYTREEMLEAIEGARTI